MAIHDVKNTTGTATDTNTSLSGTKTIGDQYDVHERLNAALSRKAPTNRSADLVPLRQDFEVMSNNFVHLISTAKKYHGSFQTSDIARMETSTALNRLLATTPLSDVSQRDMEINQRLSNKTKEMTTRYQISVIDYLEKLHKTLKVRVDTEEKQIEELRHTLTHYEQKVEKLRSKVHTKEADPKKKISPRKTAKLERNEGKLGKAWRMHEAKASRHCDLLEEITKNDWKDLYSIVSNMLSFEKDLGEQNATITRDFSDLGQQLDKIYHEGSNNDRELPIALNDPMAREHAIDTDGIALNDDSSSSSFSVSSNEAVGGQGQHGQTHTTTTTIDQTQTTTM